MDQPFFFFFFLQFLFFKGTFGATITTLNKCDYTIWPGVLSNAGSPDIGSTGFELSSGGSRSFQASPGWSGRIWARTRCGQDSTSGRWVCSTGDCRTGQLECTGSGATTPATLAEFTIGHGPTDHDFYDVSLVDGFNVPMVIETEGGFDSCLPTGCASDLNQQCPSELRVAEGDACNSACGAFATPEYCCSGTYASPSTCAPSQYSKMFKLSCPHAYSYAFDDPTSTYTCVGADYTITFCPSLTSQQKSSLGGSQSSSIGSGLGSLFDNDKCHKKVCVGGGQFLSKSPSKITNQFYFAWQYITIFISTLILSLQFFCL
ncbi:thaumatin-like protein 1b [Chenopodium quinoa]|uniref:thaumatin-like protein 1b n=1 Tax=Chenopodium quinoa TaxID=63459 RepID=UPI000B783AD7|nr:thaumatin-like protein 1b [Chenopodium quinoa]